MFIFTSCIDSHQEAARYIELFKQCEFKAPDVIKEKPKEDFLSQVCVVGRDGGDTEMDLMMVMMCRRWGF